jgi:hypothetical protein
VCDLMGLGIKKILASFVMKGTYLITCFSISCIASVPSMLHGNSSETNPELQRLQCLAALAALCPIQAGDALLAELYSPHLDMFQVQSLGKYIYIYIYILLIILISLFSLLCSVY